MLIRQRCRHCNKECRPRNRGLCYGCHMNPDIRYQYSTFCVEKDDGDFCGGYKLDSNPTYHEPGTEEKMQVFEERAKNKVALFHPHDNNGDPENARLYRRRVS